MLKASTAQYHTLTRLHKESSSSLNFSTKGKERATDYHDIMPYSITSPTTAAPPKKPRKKERHHTPDLVYLTKAAPAKLTRRSNDELRSGWEYMHLPKIEGKEKELSKKNRSWKLKWLCVADGCIGIWKEFGVCSILSAS